MRCAAGEPEDGRIICRHLINLCAIFNSSYMCTGNASKAGLLVRINLKCALVSQGAADLFADDEDNYQMGAPNQGEKSNEKPAGTLCVCSPFVLR